MTAPHRKIGQFEVYPVGLGCMNLSHAYGPASEIEHGVKLLNEALDRGCNFFDTATLYGLGKNEELVGKALGARRDEIVLASKCVLGMQDDKRVLDGRPEVIKAFCDASLKRLGVDEIDIYYLHRPDPNVPIEDSVGALLECKQAGKIKEIGLSEMSEDQVRRAHAVHPIAALQSEYSLWVRNPEIAVKAACEELGIAFVAFSPVCRGYLAEEQIDPASFHEKDIRNTMPRFFAPHWEANLALLDFARECAGKLGCTLAQLGIAWTIHQGDNIIPIPGTKNFQHMRENHDAGAIVIPADMLAALNAHFAPEKISGPRYSKGAQAGVATERYAFEADHHA